jgi:cell division protein FtsL
MKKISSIIQHFKSNPLTRLEKQLLFVIIITYVWAVGAIIILHNQSGNINALKKQNNQTIKQSEKVILLQQKEIERLKKDVVLHTMLADSSIAKANRLSKKQINNEVAFSKIDSIVNSLSVDEVNNFWNNRKSK